MSNQFAAALSPSEPDGPCPLIGLEHEYRVIGPGGPIDFRTIIHQFELGQPHLDPGDPHAYRLASGTVLTADASEAEIALPPATVRPGVVAETVSAAERARTNLEALLSQRGHLEGYSTHLSVGALPFGTQWFERVARRYCRSFGAAMMLMIDTRKSPGLLVRPRSNRFELGGEFIEGEPLAAATAFALGTFMACAQSVSDRAGELIPLLDVRLAADDHRYGWFISRRAFGSDLYAEGRETMLTLLNGARIRAGDYLACCWNAAREALTAIGMSAADLDSADQVVAGRKPLPSESDWASRVGCTSTLDAPPNEFGSMLRPRRRRHFEVAPVMATWDLSVFVLIRDVDPRIAFASVPRRQLEAFLTEMDRGGMDELIVAYLDSCEGGRWLRGPSAAAGPGLYDILGPRIGLLSVERPPEVPRPQRLLRRARQGEAPFARAGEPA